MKKTLFMVLCMALLMSCADRRFSMVDSAISEAKILQNLAKDSGLEAIASADSLIIAAEKQNADGQVTSAFVLADEAILQFQIAFQKLENKNIADTLEAATKSLQVYQNALKDYKSANSK